MQLKTFFVGPFIASLTILAACQSKEPIRPEKDRAVRLSVVAKINGLDPIFNQDVYGAAQIAHVYEPLLQYHYLKRPYELIPNLSDGMPKVSSDGRTYLFKIKKGVRFQDDDCFPEGKGRELTAKDFVYSILRLADPKNHGAGYWAVDGLIKGIDEWRKNGQSNYFAQVEGLQALDRYQLKIELIKPNAQFLYKLAMIYTAAVPFEAVQKYGKDFSRNPVGTGPFVLDRKASHLNSQMVWNRNPNYRKEFYPAEGEHEDQAAGLLEDAGKPLPRADRIIYDVVVESQPRWLKFVSGEFDLGGIPKDNFSQAVAPGKGLAKNLRDKGVQMVVLPRFDLTGTIFNMRDPILGKNKKLRQAISLALNPDLLAELFYNNRVISAQGPIAPGLDGYDPKLKNPYRIYSLQRAKRLLDQAGYPGGKGLPMLEYHAVSGSTGRQMAEFFQRSVAEIGVKIKIIQSSWPEHTRKTKEGSAQMFGMAWALDFPDPENVLQLFYGPNSSPGANFANYQNPKFDRLYEQSLKFPSGKKRSQIYRKMVELVIEDCPWVFGVHRLSYVLVQKWMKNYKLHEFEYSKAKYYRVDAQLRK